METDPDPDAGPPFAPGEEPEADTAARAAGALPAPDGGAAFRRIDRRWVAAARIGGVVNLAVLAGFGAIAISAGLPQVLGLSTEAATAIGVTLLALASAWALAAPAIAYPRWRYRTDDRVLQVEWGVVTLRSVLVPVNRIQHVDIHRGPVDRLLGLATLVVETAAVGQAVEIPGLVPDEATRLRDHLVALGGDDAV